MQIVEIDCLLLTAPYGEASAKVLRSYGVVVIQTEDGRRGFGEPYAAVNMPTACREIIHLLRGEVVGQDANAPDALMRRLHNLCEYFDHRGLVHCVLGAVELTLARGRYTRQPRAS